MNANRIITMIIRLFVQRAVRGGLSRGLRQRSNRGIARGKGQAGSDAEARIGADARKTARRARQLTRITRRLGR